MRRAIAAVFAQDNPAKLVFVATGGGVRLGSDLLSTPGASASVLEVQMPYARASQVALTGDSADSIERDGFCSAAHARRLAHAALQRAMSLSADDGLAAPADVARLRLVGLSCTAALVSATPKRGPHRCFIAAATPSGVWEREATLDKGARDRQGEDAFVAGLAMGVLLQAVGLEAEAAGVEAELQRSAQDEVSPAQFTRHAPGAARVLDEQDRTNSVLFLSNGLELADAPLRWVLVPGSFNPAHRGHETLAAQAERMAGKPAVFELSATNADKPPLPLATVQERVAQFADGPRPVVVTRAPLFVDKARLFPGCDFVVGADTAIRVLNPKYYGGTEAHMVAALSEFQHLGCTFWVGGRLMSPSSAEEEGVHRYMTLAELEPLIPPPLAGLFRCLENERVDLSSTELRAAAAAAEAGAAEHGVVLQPPPAPESVHPGSPATSRT